ncbi:MAG: hypothetical protein ACKVVP_15765 [Chloroflexota bacterium]
MVLHLSRSFPAILAPYKTSAHVLWVAPLVDLALFIPVSLAAVIGIRLVRRRFFIPGLPILYGLFGFLGALTVLTGPKLLHPLSAVVLSLGLAVVLGKQIRGSELRLTSTLQRWLPAVPIVLLIVALTVAGAEVASERWFAAQLPPVGSP